MIKSSYESWLPDGINVYWFWSAIACMILIVSYVVTEGFKVSLSFPTRIALGVLVYVWPIGYAIIAHKFYNVFQNHIEPLFHWPDGKANTWYEENAENSFQLKKKNLLVTLILFVIGVVTIFLLPRPFPNKTASIIARLGFTINMFIGFHSVPLLFFCIQSLYKLIDKDVKANYYYNGYTMIQGIQRFYFGVALFITVINASLFLGFYYSPFGQSMGWHAFAVYWIVFISTWPIIMYFTTFYCIRKITQNAKNVYIIPLNNHLINPSLEKIINDPDNVKDSDFEDVKRNITFREYLAKYSSGSKVDVSSLLILLAAVLGGAFQIIATLLSKS